VLALPSAGRLGLGLDFAPVDGARYLALWQGRYKRPFIARIRKAFSALAAYSRR